MTALRSARGTLLARLLAGYAAVALVLAGAWLWSLYEPLTDAALRQQQRNLTAVAQSAALLTAESESTPEQIARQLVARTDLRLTIVAADGTVLADSGFDPRAMENHGGRPEIAAALAGDVGVDRRVSRTQDVEELYVAVPASLRGARIAVRVSQPLTEIEAIAARSRRVGLGLLFAALAVASVVSVRAARGAAEPVRRLSASAERMAAGDLEAPVPHVPADLDALASSLTRLRDEVRARIGALDAERTTLEAALDGLSDAVLLVEADRAVYVNREATRLFGLQRVGLSPVPLAELGLPAPVAEAIRIRVGSGGSGPLELPPDPLGKTYRVLVTDVSSDATSPRTVAVISDVTERARVDRVRRDFVANASHELKTPVAGIRLLADSAGDAAADGDTEVALTFTRQISAEAERLQHLVSDLLDLSRLDTTPAPDAVADVRAAVDRAVVSHGPQARRKGLSLASDLTRVEGESVFVTAEPTDLAVALDNLVDNAICYTAEGSVEVLVSADADSVSISVVDTGPGIAAEHLGRVFERFYRVDTGRSRDAGGTGLGLALVRHAAERARGSVDVTSELGSGSSFTLRLPRAV